MDGKVRRLFSQKTSPLHRWNAPLLTGLLMAVLAASGISSFALTVPILTVRGIFTACLTQPTTILPRHRLAARRPANYSEHAVSGAPERLEGRHAFPIAVPEAALASAAIRFSGGTHVGDSGSIAGWDGARLGGAGVIANLVRSGGSGGAF